MESASEWHFSVLSWEKHHKYSSLFRLVGMGVSGRSPQVEFVSYGVNEYKLTVYHFYPLK